VREDVACVQRIAPQTAASRLSDATDLVCRLPDTLAMLERGELSMLAAPRTGTGTPSPGLEWCSARSRTAWSNCGQRCRPPAGSRRRPGLAAEAERLKTLDAQTGVDRNADQRRADGPPFLAAEDDPPF
jgi:hypothetical protein